MLKRIANTLIGALLAASPALAQSTDPNTWPATFESASGPYAWLTPADASARGLSLANAVIGGQEGTQSLPVCRAPHQGGVHPGKFFANNCNIGWGGNEIAVSSGFEVLYQTQPEQAQYLPQTWVAKGTPGTLVGGQEGTLTLRVCRAPHQGGTHPGKEVGGNCNIGWGGQEVVIPQYELLALTFDRTAWQAAQTPVQAAATDPNDPNTWPQYFRGENSMGPYAWLTLAEISARGLSLANAVIGGQEGTQPLPVCRASYEGGTHPGKLYANNCNIGYGGQEVAVSQGYQVLVNTQPDKAPFLTLNWVNPTYGDRNTLFQGGSASGKPMNVCHAWANVSDTHPGKEWEGNCHYGFGGQERVDAAYGLLVLGFDQAAWQAAQSQVTIGTTTGTLNLNTNLTLNQSTTTITPGTETFTEGPSPDMLSYADAVRRSWTPDNLGRGLIDLANSLPNLMNALVARYNELIVRSGYYKDGAALLAGVKNGEANAEGPMVNLLVGLAKEILDRDPATWSKDEANLIQFIQCLAQNQRQKTAALAKQAFDEWYASEQDKAAQSGLILLANVITDPPPEILAMAQKGYSVPPQHANNFSEILAASAGFSSGMLTFAAGVGTGAGLNFVAAFVPTVNAAISFGRGLGGMMAGSGAFAVVTLLVTAGIIQTIDVIQYEEYVKNLNDAVASLQQPVSVNQLKSLLSSAEDGKAVYYWFIAQAATK
jgi:hypothetical protein